MAYFLSDLFQSSQLSVENCFELLMNKKYSSETKEKKDKLIYDFLSLSKAKPEVELVNKKIKKLNPRNLQILLTLAHDLALKQNPEKAKAFENQLNELQAKYHLKQINSQNLRFDENLEKKIKPRTISWSTLGKAFGLSLLILVPSLGVNKLLENRQETQSSSQGSISLNQVHHAFQNQDQNILQACKPPLLNIETCKAGLDKYNISLICSNHSGATNSTNALWADGFCDCKVGEGLVCFKTPYFQKKEQEKQYFQDYGLMSGVLAVAMSCFRLVTSR